MLDILSNIFGISIDTTRYIIIGIIILLTSPFALYAYGRIEVTGDMLRDYIAEHPNDKADIKVLRKEYRKAVSLYIISQAPTMFVVCLLFV